MSTLKLPSHMLEWREVGGEVIALEQERAAYLSTNRSGTLLWRALAEGSTEPELTQLLVSEYGIDAATASADVGSFVADLRRRGLLETS
jgi:hypothetical protein